MKKKICYLLMTFLVLTIFSCQTSKKKNNYKTLDIETYRDKMKGAWVGQMAGVGWGLPTEFDFVDTFINDEQVPEWKNEMVNQQGNDDLYVEMTFLSTLDQYGLDASIRQAGIDFANTGYTLWAANKTGRRNLRYGIAPPASSHPRYSNNCDDIDYQIEADYSGIIAPGMLNVPVKMGEKFGRLMNYGDGMYGGQFVGTMYAAAYFENDIKKVIQTGLKTIPAESDYAACVKDVIKWHEKYPEDWKKTWQLIEKNYHTSYEHQKFARLHDAWIPIDAKINGAYIVLGLLYGEGDIEKTMKIAMQGGKDSDCNPSNAGGILGTMIGFNAIPEKFKTALDVEKKFSYSNYNFNDLMQLTEKFTRELIIKNGGEILKTDEGKEIFQIAIQAPVPSRYHPSFAPGPVANDSLFTDEEMKQILAYSSLHFNPIMKKLGLEMEIYHCGKAVEPALTQWNGKTKVLTTCPMSNERSVLMTYKSNKNNISENQTPHLKFSAGYDKDKRWKLIVKDRQNKQNRLVLDTIISGVPGQKGWIDFDIKLTQGKPANFNIEASRVEQQVAINYWHNIKIETR